MAFVTWGKIARYRGRADVQLDRNEQAGGRPVHRSWQLADGRTVPLEQCAVRARPAPPAGNAPAPVTMPERASRKLDERAPGIRRLWSKTDEADSPGSVP